MLAEDFNRSTWEVEADISVIWRPAMSTERLPGQEGLHVETLPRPLAFCFLPVPRTDLVPQLSIPKSHGGESCILKRANNPERLGAGTVVRTSNHGWGFLQQEAGMLE